jgi:DNA-binding HxlR family transcriptional regulator
MAHATEPEAVTPNAIGATLGLLGDEWSLQLVRYSFAGVRRYGEWKEQLGIADAVLSARLAALVGAGVLVRVAYSDRPPRFEYRLAPAGLDLWRSLLAIWSWELHHVPGQSAQLPRMVHRDCGAEFEPVLRCARCHSPAGIDDVSIALGPSGAFARSMPVGTNRRRATTRPTPTMSTPTMSAVTMSTPTMSTLTMSTPTMSAVTMSTPTMSTLTMSTLTMSTPTMSTPTMSTLTMSAVGMFPETMALIGSRWSSAVLGAAFLGATRFTDFATMIGAPPTVVADRVRSFTDLGVLEPVEVDGRPDRSTYHLTKKGRAFFPAVASFLAWGERWLPAPDGPAVLATHRRCGRAFVPELACSTCDGELTRRSVGVTTAH